MRHLVTQMTTKNTAIAEAISFSEKKAIVLVPAHVLDAILSEIRDLRKEFDSLCDEVASERAADRRRLRALETPEPQPAQIDSGKILIGLLATHEGRMPALEARQMMHMSKQSFSNLLDTLPSIESLPMKTDKRRRMLALKI